MGQRLLAMPHKKNPVLTENLTGLARLVRMTVVPAMENVALARARHLALLGRARHRPGCNRDPRLCLNRLAGVIEKMLIFPDNMLDT